MRSLTRQLLACYCWFSVAFTVVLADAQDPEEVTNGDVVLEPSVVGGVQVDASAVPWQAAVVDKYDLVFCGATILSKNWVVSAQHCFEFNEPKYIVVGSSFRDFRSDPYAQVREVELIISHPNYASTSLGNDIVLIRVANEGFKLGESTKAEAIALDDRQVLSGNDSRVGVISGFGVFEPESPQRSEYLQRAFVPLVANDVAQDAYRKNGFPSTTIYPSQVVAGNLSFGMVDTCLGDSGGPLVTLHGTSQLLVLTGITSFGKGCAQPNHPGVYTRVSYFYKWIKRIIEDFESQLNRVAQENRTSQIELRESLPTAVSGTWYQREVTVPQNALLLDVTVTGYVDMGLYLNYGFEPDPPRCSSSTDQSDTSLSCPPRLVPEFSRPLVQLVTAYDCISQRPGNVRRCQIAFPFPGTWYIGVFTYMDVEFDGQIKITAAVLHGDFPISTVTSVLTISNENPKRVITQTIQAVPESAMDIRFDSFSPKSVLQVRFNQRQAKACVINPKKNTCERSPLRVIAPSAIDDPSVLVTARIQLPRIARSADERTVLSLSYVPARYVRLVSKMGAKQAKWSYALEKIAPGTKVAVIVHLVSPKSNAKKRSKVKPLAMTSSPFLLDVSLNGTGSALESNQSTPTNSTSSIGFKFNTCSSSAVFSPKGRFLKCNIVGTSFTDRAEISLQRLNRKNNNLSAMITIFYEQKV